MNTFAPVMEKAELKQSVGSGFTFADVFAGIGGFHLAFHNLGAECVFAAEWDRFARETYTLNHKKISPELFSSQNFAHDITKVEPQSIPDFDILCAGFPCQPFSQAGFKKGFDEVRGTLFFNLVEIIAAKRPKAFFLENVRHLKNHDEGRTFETIKRVLECELGYSFSAKVVKASDHGLPQYRPRLFMVGFRDKGLGKEFRFPEPKTDRLSMSEVWGGYCPKEIGYTLRVGGRGSGVGDRRNWDGYMVDGVERRLGPREGLKMQGFPSSFRFPVSETQAMKQLGNSVAVPAIQAVGENIMRVLKSEN